MGMCPRAAKQTIWFVSDRAQLISTLPLLLERNLSVDAYAVKQYNASRIDHIRVSDASRGVGITGGMERKIATASVKMPF